MQMTTEEIARRILESVLRQLEGATPHTPAVAAVKQAGNESAGRPPLVILMLGDSAPAPGATRPANQSAMASPLVNGPAGCGCQNNSPAAAENSLQLLHPGLERFDLPEDHVVFHAPRMCFVEPERVCVGSGACEMRGY
jgi:hypothetical protein